MDEMNSQEIRDRITQGVREYLTDRLRGGFYRKEPGGDGLVAITAEGIELDVTGIVESVVDDLNEGR